MSSLETTSSHSRETDGGAERAFERAEQRGAESESQRLDPAYVESVRSALREGTDATAKDGEAEPCQWENVIAESRFRDMKPSEYHYETDGQGRCSRAYGQLVLQKGERDSAAQREAGGEARRAGDDGGHLIGARFGGAADEANMVAQDRNLNRGEYKVMENHWAEALQRGDKVYVDVMAYYNNDDSTRPQVIFGSYIIEKSDGSHEREDFSCYNETKDFREEIHYCTNVDNPDNWGDDD